MKRASNKKILFALGYTAFFFAMFAIFAYLTFPYERVRDFIVQEVERPAGPDGRRKASGMELEIEELSPSWITGVELTKVVFRKPSDEEGATGMEIKLDELELRPSIIGLLTGNLGASFEAAVGDGSIEGAYDSSEEETSLDLELDAVDLADLGALASLLKGLPVTGTATGTIDLTLADDVKATTGEIDLSLTGLSIGDGEAKLKVGNMGDGFTIERINAGDVKIRFEVEEGVARVKEFSASGDDLELAASGTIRLIKELRMSRLDLLIRLKFTDAYKERNERTRALFSLMELTPQVRPARTSDGALQFRLSGSVGSGVTPVAAGRARMR